MGHPPRSVALALVLLAACGGDESESEAQPPPPDPDPPPACPPPERLVGEACVPPGVSDDGVAAGIGADGCAPGFEHDGDVGCEPLLPADTCSGSQMAVPGETTCRDIMPCGAGKWGDLPVDPSTQYVDGSYAGMDSDGSESKPWLTIVDAYSAADQDDLIAIAEGVYFEEVIISNKPVRLWGVCPAKVAIGGIGNVAVAVRGGSDGTVIGGMQITGMSRCVTVSGSHATLERAWVTGCGSRAVEVDNLAGPGTLTIDGSVIEESEQIAVNVSGAALNMQASVVRNNAPSGNVRGGLGIFLQVPCVTNGPCRTELPSSATITGSVIVNNIESGVAVIGSQLTMEGSVIRDTRPDLVSGALGYGLAVQPGCDDEGCDYTTPTTATVVGSVIERNSDANVFVTGATASFERTVVRDGVPVAGERGHGVQAEVGCDSKPPAPCVNGVAATLTMKASLVERHQGVGVLAVGADASLDTTVVRDVVANPQGIGFGRAVNVELCPRCTPVVSGSLSLTASVIERSIEFGVSVTGSPATAHAIAVRDVSAATDGRFGDGVVVSRFDEPALLSFTASSVDNSVRAGLSTFGADVALASAALRCAAFELAGESFQETPFTLDDQGNNLCGCPQADEPCKAQSAGLEPPPPLAP